MSCHTSLRHRGNAPNESRNDRLVKTSRPRADPHDEREAERDRHRIREDGGQALFPDLIEEVLQIAEERRERTLVAAEASFLLEATGRDEETTSALAPLIGLDRILDETARERLVARVAKHRVHHDRRIADREQASLTNRSRDRNHDVGLVRSAASDLEHGREIGMREARRMIRDDAGDVLNDGMRACRLGERELRVVAERLGWTFWARDP